ncbi:hypothetical protein Q7O_001770 [Pectobacterium carotovorum subsp. carotovorum PCCS1]|nr:hypothetical protein [Pectobacterium carotovorum subsp. carotovorum PCCS1]
MGSFKAGFGFNFSPTQDATLWNGNSVLLEHDSHSLMLGSAY